MDDANKIVVRTARKLPTVVFWIGLGVLCGLTLSITGTNLIIPYILAGTSGVLWFLFCRTYDMATTLFNELSLMQFISRINKLQEEGTLLDIDGLTEYDPEKDNDEK